MRDDTARLRDILDACELLVREIGPRVTELRTERDVPGIAGRIAEILGER